MARVNKHDVHTVVEMGWPDQIENGELLTAGQEAGFDVMVTSDQNIRYQENLTGRKLALVVLGSNIRPVVWKYGDQIAACVDAGQGSPKKDRGIIFFGHYLVNPYTCRKCGRDMTLQAGR